MNWSFSYNCFVKMSLSNIPMVPKHSVIKILNCSVEKRKQSSQGQADLGLHSLIFLDT